MQLGGATRMRLSDQDEYPHPIEAAHNFNESMYINLFDHQQRIGGWFRVGNRPNEGHAEVSFCVYLPDGRVAFAFSRPESTTNTAFSAGGLTFAVEQPFRTLTLTFAGEVLILDDPQRMTDPRQAFLESPRAPAEANLRFTAFTPVYGGEVVDADGNPLPEKADEAFARAHYEQHMQGEGTIHIGAQQFNLQGFGLRDHSWGPRYWQNLYWYRWFPMAFSAEFAINISIIQMRNGTRPIWGMVYDTRQGEAPIYQHVCDARLQSRWDDHHQAQAQSIWLKTEAGREYEVSGTALSMIPLRNRRQNDQGEWQLTRITEAMSQFNCDGVQGFGMAEYLDQIENSLPVGLDC